jgi:hypothetical protein
MTIKSVLSIKMIFELIKEFNIEAEKEEMKNHFREQMVAHATTYQSTSADQNNLTEFEWTEEAFRFILEVRLWCQIIEPNNLAFPALADANFYKTLSGGKNIVALI